jgi:flagellar biosynthesis protein FlhG
MKIRCAGCKSKLEIRDTDFHSSDLYECPYCSWIIDLGKIKTTGRTILIASGKGGVGKSLTATNISISLAEQGNKVVVIDANLGLANQHILMNVNNTSNLYQYLKGEKSLDEIITPTEWDVDLIKGSAEIHEISELKNAEQLMIYDKHLSLETEYDFTIVDLPTGYHENTKFYFKIANEMIILTSMNITSISDTYRLVKAVSSLNNNIKIGLIINRVKTKTDAEQVFDELANYCFRFHDVFIHFYGYIIDNPLVDASIQQRIPLLISNPDCNASKCIREIASRILSEEKIHTLTFQNKDRNRLIESFKYPPFLFLPETSKEERRIAQRINLKERLLYTYIAADNDTVKPLRGPGITENISLTGILFKSADIIPETKHILLTFNFNNGKPVRMSGKVVHNHIKDDKNRNCIGVEFTQFFDQSKELLGKFISSQH